MYVVANVHCRVPELPVPEIPVNKQPLETLVPRTVGIISCRAFRGNRLLMLVDEINLNPFKLLMPSPRVRLIYQRPRAGTIDLVEITDLGPVVI